MIMKVLWSRPFVFFSTPFCNKPCPGTPSPHIFCCVSWSVVCSNIELLKCHLQKCFAVGRENNAQCGALPQLLLQLPMMITSKKSAPTHPTSVSREYNISS